VSTANLANLVSTTYLATQIGSTVIGLGTAGYLSTGFSNLIANTFTTSTATLQFITTSSILFGTGTGYLTLPNSVIPNLSVGIIYASTIVGFAPGGGFNVSSLVSTPNLADLVSTSLLNSAFASTLTSLGNEFTTNHLITPLITNNNTISIDTFNDIDLHAAGNITISSSTFMNLNSRDFIAIRSPITYFVAPDQVNLAPVYLSSITFTDTNFSTSQITTDPTITNLYWNGSQLNNPTFGDVVSTANLADLVSTSYLLNGIEFSSLSNESARLNFSSIFVNNVPILFDQYGNLSLSFQTL
jgi:hypothetical protein